MLPFVSLGLGGKEREEKSKKQRMHKGGGKVETRGKKIKKAKKVIK